MSRYRKEKTMDYLKKSIDKCLDDASSKGLFDTEWEIPKKIVEKKTYFHLIPIMDYYKSEKYTVEFLQDPEECKYIYFSWFG